MKGECITHDNHKEYTNHDNLVNKGGDYYTTPNFATNSIGYAKLITINKSLDVENLREAQGIMVINLVSGTSKANIPINLNTLTIKLNGGLLNIGQSNTNIPLTLIEYSNRYEIYGYSSYAYDSIFLQTIYEKQIDGTIVLHFYERFNDNLPSTGIIKSIPILSPFLPDGIKLFSETSGLSAKRQITLVDKDGNNPVTVGIDADGNFLFSTPTGKFIFNPWGANSIKEIVPKTNNVVSLGTYSNAWKDITSYLMLLRTPDSTPTPVTGGLYYDGSSFRASLKGTVWSKVITADVISKAIDCGAVSPNTTKTFEIADSRITVNSLLSVIVKRGIPNGIIYDIYAKEGNGVATLRVTNVTASTINVDTKEFIISIS